MKKIHYGILGATTILASLSPAMAEALEKIGVVGLAGTTVTATGEDGAARVLKTGDDVFLNDRIVSDAGGKAQLIFLDRSTLTLNANTDLTLDKYVYDPATAGGTMAVSSVKGAFRFVGGALSKKQPVTIKTPVATIGIRGGIADTNVQPGGASDAVFVYGEELTMTNQNGDTFSTTQVGTGLMLDSPTGTPQPMPANVVNQRMRAFGTPSPDASDGGDGGTGGGESGTGTGGSGSGGSSSNTSGSSGNSSSANTSGGAGGSVSGGSPDGVAGEPTGQNAGTAKIKVAIIQGDEGVLPGIKDVPQVKNTLPPTDAPAGNDTGGTGGGSTDNGGLPGGEEGTQIVNPDPAPTPPPPSSSSSGGSTTPTPKLTGRYFHHDASPNMVAKGGIESDAALEDVVFTELDRKGGPIFINDLDTTPGAVWLDETSPAGANYASYGQVDMVFDYDEDGVSDSVVSGNFYETPGGAFTQYYFNGSGEPITFYLGNNIFGDSTALDSSRMSEAVTASRGASTSLAGIGVYSFLPDIGRYPSSAPNADYGLLDHRIAGSTVSSQLDVLEGLGYGSQAAEHLRDGPGLMVDWQNGRFLSSYVEFKRDTATTEPSALLAAGVVNPNGPNFLDGKIQHFEGEDATVAASVTSTNTGSGRFKVGREIYANPNAPIEAMMVEVNAAAKPTSVNSGFAYATNGSTQINVTLFGGDYEAGDTIEFSGVTGDIGGIPASSFNGQKFRILSYTSNVATIDVGVTASASTGNAAAFTVTEVDQGSQAAVIDTSHGLNATDFTSGVGKRTGAEMRGFAGGLVKGQTTAGISAYASTAVVDGNNKIQDVVIRPNAASGSINTTSKIKLTHEYTGAGSPGASYVEGNFGGVDSAYMNDQHYGAAQTSANIDSAPGTVNSGFIATGTTDKTVTHCTSCQYTHWGVWAADVSDSSADNYAVEMVPYVAGRVTDASEFDAYRASMGNTGTANYSGVAYGSFESVSKIQNAAGTMTADVDLAARTVDNMNISFSNVHGANLTITNAAAMAVAVTGDAVFNGNANVSWPSANAAGGYINGALFGPNAEEIGGNFAIQHNEGMTITGGGVFQGAR